MVEDFPEGNKLFGFYRGQVLKHCEHGKCKLWIPSVYPIEWRSNPNFIPDAEQAAPLFGGSFGGNGVFSWPDIGSIVWCFFQNGDQNLPVYFATALGGIDAYDQYVRNANADRVFLQEPKDTRLSTTLEMSRVHRINSGKSSVTMFEDGRISARTEFPIESTTGTMGSNCTYAEWLAHFYADKGLWSYDELVPIEDHTLRIALTVKKDGAASSFKSAFKADADAKPPKIDVFFYAESSGSGGKDVEDDELPPAQDTTIEKTEDKTKKGIYFCTIGRRWEGALDNKFDYFNNNKAFIEQLQFAAKEKYELFVCQADFFKRAPIIKGFDMANLRQIPARKDEVKPTIDKLASFFGINILAICPKHTYTDLVMDDFGSLSSCSFNDFTQISSKLNIDVDGKISAYTSHLMSADMLSQDNWPTLGYSFSRASIDSAGNSFLDGVYTTKTTEVSCIFDMTTKEHIKAELNSAKVDGETRRKQTAVVCAYDCDTIKGIADLSVVYYDFNADHKTYSRIRMTKDGEISVNCTKQLEVLVKEDKGESKSHMFMHQNGKVKLDSTDSINIEAPNITIAGDKVVMSGKDTTNITGKTGDCKIDRVSLVKHKHKHNSDTSDKPIKQ